VRVSHELAWAINKRTKRGGQRASTMQIMKSEISAISEPKAMIIPAGQSLGNNSVFPNN
jgi:hypothetical protein